MRTLALALTLMLLTACGGGARLVRDAPPPPLQQTLAQASTATLTAQLQWVITPEGPGSWSRKAQWDEYLLRVHNTSAAPLQLTAFTVVDSTDQPVRPGTSRADLVEGTARIFARYRSAGIAVHSEGSGIGRMGSTTAGVVGGTAATMGIVGAGTGAAASYAVSGAALGVIFATPVLATMGVMRLKRNHDIAQQITARQTTLPLTLPAGGDVLLDLFVPLVPSPTQLRLEYRAGDRDEALEIDTRQALAGLHLMGPPVPSR